MARDLDDVVDAAEQPEVTVLVALAAVPREVHAGDLAPVLALVALRVAVDAAKHARPRPLDHEIAGLRRLPLVVDDLGLDARERKGRRARLADRGPRQRRYEDVPGLRLPPGVDDRAPGTADHLPVPDPRFGVDRLPDATQ